MPLPVAFAGCFLIDAVRRARVVDVLPAAGLATGARGVVALGPARRAVATADLVPLPARTAVRVGRDGLTVDAVPRAVVVRPVLARAAAVRLVGVRAACVRVVAVRLAVVVALARVAFLVVVSLAVLAFVFAVVLPVVVLALRAAGVRVVFARVGTFAVRAVLRADFAPGLAAVGRLVTAALARVAPPRALVPAVRRPPGRTAIAR